MDIAIEKAKTLKPKPPADALGFGKYFTDHMFIMTYDEGRGWHSPTIKPYGPLAIDPAAMVLHYGQAVFEGLKCYRAEDGRLLLFRPWDNFKRLNVSDERMCIPALDEDFALDALTQLIQLEKDWVPSAPGTSLYIRPFTMAVESCVGVRPSSSYYFIIILSPVGAYYPQGFKPVKIFIEDEYVRAVKGGIGYTKASANYASSLKGQVKAHERGYTQVLWLDGIHRKYIEEVGAMNVFFHIGDELVTPSLEGSILPGITRDSVLQLARRQGMKTAERRIAIDELYAAHADGTLHEAFGSGTAAVISPIGELNWRDQPITLSGGEVGPVAARLYDTLTGIQCGRCPDELNWVRAV